MNKRLYKVMSALRYGLAALCLMTLLGGVVHAMTAANTLINNQATATYTDAANAARTVSSNTVQTQVQQIAALTLTADQSKPGAAGNTLVFPHVVTNTGNGVDTYDLVTADLFGGAGIDFAFTALRILPDADGNGVADSAAIINQSPALNAGEHFSFVVEADVPAGASDSQVGQFTITATSVFDNAEQVLNTDTVNVTDRAIIEVTKSLSASQGLAGSGTYRVNLIYNNPSNKIATNVTLIDILPTEMLYVGNAVWSIGNVTLTDANEDVQSATPSITFCAYDASCSTAPFANNQVTLIIDEVGAGQSGTVSFDVNISASANPGLIFNTANYQYNDTVSLTALQNSNAAPFEILPTVAVDIVGATAPNAQPGQTVSFTNVITNNGNAIDTFKITLDTATTNFPPATVFNLFSADGFTPLTDTNGDGVVDTGPINPGGTVNVILKAVLPSTITANTYSIDKIATSENNPSIDDRDADTVTVVLPTLPVDLTNNFPRGDANCDNVADSCGFGAGPSASSQNTVAIAPDAEGTFVLYATNTSSVSDSFDLDASTDPSFSSIGLPPGWNVSYVNDADTLVTNTGPIAPGDSVRIRALVSVPAGYEAGTVDVYFRVNSSVTGGQDIKHDGVDVTETENLLLTPDNSGQTNPGSFINYTHNLVNNGNVAEANIVLSTSDTLTADGWSSSIFEDTNGSGVFDSGDVLISNIANLPAGANRLLFVRVFVPTTAAQGVTNTTTLTASYNAGADSLQSFDVTRANRFNVDLVKKQALDADCDGEADGGAASFTLSSFTVAPGQCLVYELDTQNNASEQVLNVQIYDATPVYTLYGSNQPAVRCVPAVCTFVVEPVANGTGQIQASAGALNAGQSVRLYFNVRLEE